MLFLVLSSITMMAQSAKDLEKGREYFEKYEQSEKAKNYATAFKYAKKSAELNYPKGIASVGICYGAGYGTAVDYEQSIIWLKKAMEHPEEPWAYSTGLYNISYYYKDGLNSTGLKDFAKAARFLSEHIDNLNGDYEWTYGVLNRDYSDQEINSNKDLAYVFDFFEVKGFGNKTNSFPYQRSFVMGSDFAIEKVKALVENGNKEASVYWGIYLYNDKATSQDKANAISLWEKYTDIDLAQDLLIIAKGEGTYNKDIPKEWYLREKHSQTLYTAADKGNAEALFTRGIEYDLKNNDARMGWYEKAMAQGHAKAKERIEMLNKEKAEKEKAEKERKAAEEKLAAERKAQENAKKKNSEGRQITWTETVTYDIGRGGLGQALVDAFGGSALHEVRYTVRYTAIVEKVIAGESVKCIIKSAEIEDPGLASANYLKYRKYARAEISENIGQTRVLDMDEFSLK